MVAKSLPGDLGESNLSPWTFVLIYFWEKLNVFENWTKAVNLILREKKNAHQPTTHCFAGLQRATDPRLEALSGMWAFAAARSGRIPQEDRRKCHFLQEEGAD